MATRSIISSTVTIAILFAGAPAFGVGLSRTTTSTSSDATAWIMAADYDSESDNGTYSSNAHAVAYDINDPHIQPFARSTAAVNALATAPSAPPVVRINGSTYTDSYLGGGYTDGNGNWYAGSAQTFSGSCESDSTVTSDGTLNHQISFSLQTGAGTQEGYFYGWIRVGNVQVYFSWYGGNEVEVEEYVDGTLDDSFTILNNFGNFTYDTPFDQNVLTGDVVEVDAYGFFIDDNNPFMATRTITMLGGTN